MRLMLRVFRDLKHSSQAERSYLGAKGYYREPDLIPQEKILSDVQSRPQMRHMQENSTEQVWNA